MPKKILSLIVIICFFLTSLSPLPKAHADSVLDLPTPGSMVNLSPVYEPVIIKGLTVHKDNPFLFDFIVDVGQDKMSGEPLKKEGEKLIKYFLASLAIPDKDVWVNLSPYEKNKMIPEALGQTDMGRDLLEQDYILKQLTASLIYPEKQLGKTFWNRVYAKAREMYGTTQIPVNTFNKVWITADRAEVFEHNQTAFVVDSHMKVMLEEDYLALTHHSQIKSHTIASQVVRQIILPEIEKEVNTGKNFAHLRQILNSLILANWYKNNLKQALLNQVYTNQGKVKGINLNDPTVKQQIYEQYLKAYKKGVFNYIKEETTAQGDFIPRKYFSGGFDEAMAVKNPMVTEDPAKLGNLPDEAMVTMTTGLLSFKNPDAAMTTTSDKVRAIIAQTLGLEINEVTPEAHFTDWVHNDMYMDSRINVALQNRFKIDIPFDFILNEWTVGRMITYIQEHIDLLPGKLRVGQIQLKITDKDNLIEGNLEELIKVGKLNENEIIKEFTYRIEITDPEKIIGQLGAMFGQPSAIYLSDGRVVTAEEANDLVKQSASVRAYRFDPDKIGKFLLGARPPYLRDEFKKIMKALSTQMIIFSGESMNRPDAAMESITNRVKTVIADVIRFEGNAAEIDRHDTLIKWGIGSSNKRYLIRMLETEFNEFHIVISFKDAEKMQTVGDIITFIQEASNGSDAAMTGELGLTLGKLREALKADENLHTPNSPVAYFNGQPLSLDNVSSDIPLFSRVAMALIAKVGPGTDNKFYYSIDNRRTDRTVIYIIKFTEPYNTTVNIGGLVIGGAIAYFPYSILSEYLSTIHSLSPGTTSLISILAGASSAAIIALFYREIMHWSENHSNVQSADVAMTSISSQDKEILDKVNGIEHLKGNVAVEQFVADSIKKLGIDPTDVQVIDSEDDARLLQEEATENPNGFVLLSNGKDYYARSHPKDTARSVERTFVATENEDDKGTYINWRKASELKQEVMQKLQGSYKGRKIYVIPYLMGPVNSEFSQVGVQITDSRYVAISTIRMAKVGEAAIDHLNSQEEPGSFVRGIHSTGDLDEIHLLKEQKNIDERYFVSLPDERMILSFGSGYGGNVLFGKKFQALRQAMRDGFKNGWLAEHMFILEVEDLQGEHKGRKRYIAGAFPSASGKTNMSFIQVPAALKDQYATRVIGDDIAWLRKGKDGRLYAVNPEDGAFGVIYGTGEDTNANFMQMLKGPSAVIYTNVAYNSKTHQVWWEGKDKAFPSLEGDGQYWEDWKGDFIIKREVTQGDVDKMFKGRQLDSLSPEELLRIKASKGLWAHKNSRATVSLSNGKGSIVSPELYNPKGVPISAILWGGRNNYEPLIRQLPDSRRGIYDGLTMMIEATAATEGKEGKVEADPFAQSPFFSIHETDYVSHEDAVLGDLANPPQQFHVNWFKRDENNKFMWPGFSDNFRVLKWALDRTEGKGEAVETPMGATPTPDALNLQGLEDKVSPLQLNKLLAGDHEYYKREVQRQTEFLRKLENDKKKFPDFIWQINSQLRREYGLDAAMTVSVYATYTRNPKDLNSGTVRSFINNALSQRGLTGNKATRMTLTMDVKGARLITNYPINFNRPYDERFLDTTLDETDYLLFKAQGSPDLAMLAKKHGAARDFADLLVEDIDHGSYDWQRGSYQGYNSQTLLIGEISLKSGDIVIDDTAIGQKVKSLRTGDEVKTSGKIAHIFNFSDGRVIVFSGIGGKTSLMVDSAMLTRLNPEEEIPIAANKTVIFKVGFESYDVNGASGVVKNGTFFIGQATPGSDGDVTIDGLRITVRNGQVYAKNTARALIDYQVKDAAMAANKKIFDLGEKPLVKGEKVEIKLSKLATFYMGKGDSRPYYEISTSGENGAVELALVFQGQEQIKWQFLGYVGLGIENPETPGLKINLTNGKLFVEKESTNSGEVHYKIDGFSKNSSPAQAPEVDKAALAQIPGGIDLNTSNGMQWKVNKDGNGVEMNIDPAMIERIKREGIDNLSPVIYKITPVTSIWPLVGLQVPSQAERSAGA